MALWYDCGSGMLRTMGFARSRSPLTVLFCCPGPSLRAVRNEDLHIPGVLVAAINTAYPHVRPDIWAGLDKPMAYDSRLWSEPFIKIMRGGFQDLQCTTGRVAECANTFFGDAQLKVAADRMLDRRDHDVKFIMSGGTFTFMLHLLIWQGYKNIFLVGCDFGGTSDYHDDRRLDGAERRHNRQLYRQVSSWLPRFAVKAARRGIRITSATEGSPINAHMPYTPLADVLAGLKGVSEKVDARVLHCKKADVCNWAHARPRAEEGIVVGCDDRQEHLLPGWYHCLRKHDQRPILFADFGLSESMVEWSRRRGEYAAMKAARAHLANWWLKPCAILASPYARSLWLDVDCVVQGSLDPIFASLGDGQICVRPSQFAVKSTVPSYNSGVVCVRHGARIVEEWGRRVMLDADKFRGDQDVLNQVLNDEGVAPMPLPPEANWFVRSELNPAATIQHFTGPSGKELLARQWAENLIFVHIKSDNVGDIASCPAHYLPFDQPYSIVDWGAITPDWMARHGDADIIVGGGGLASHPERLSLLADTGSGRRIAWGIGRAGRGTMDYGPYREALGRFALCGVRDPGSPFEYVPCPSCLHPAFDTPIEPTEDVVVYNHQHHPFEVPEGVRQMNNGGADAGAAIRFLATGRTVVTSSYHGVIWAMWLGRRVLMQKPWSVKFTSFAKPPGICIGQDWRMSLGKAVDYSGEGLLDAARARTATFHAKVREWIGTRIPDQGRQEPGHGEMVGVYGDTGHESTPIPRAPRRVKARPGKRRAPPPAGRAAAIGRRLSATNGTPISGVEIGVLAGRLSAFLLGKMPTLSLRMVDPWKAAVPGSSWAGSGDGLAALGQAHFDLARKRAGAAVAFAGDRAVIDPRPSLEAVMDVADGSLDFAFIDANHSYEGASADAAAWFPKVKPGGWLCGHDYGNPRWGVQRAVDEFAAKIHLPVETDEDRTWFIQVPATSS